MSRQIAWPLLLSFLVVTSSLLFLQVNVKAAMTIQPGFDLFQTDSVNTHFSFMNEFTLPSGFFGTGSDAFTGNVSLGGVPFGYSQIGGNPSPGNYTGTTDTIVQRLGAADLSSGSATVQTQLVALSLMSVNPITVTYNGGASPSFFDIFVDISPSIQSMGNVTISSGGTFNSFLTVFPLLTFVRENDTFTRQLDVGQKISQICGAFVQQCIRDLTLQATGTPWAAPPCPSDDFIVTGLNDQFCPGSTPTQPTRFVEVARLDQHSVIPVQGPHWKCYQITPPTSQPPLNKQGNLRDQFENETGVTIGVSQLLCNPVSKLLIQGVRSIQFSPPLEPHLKCYTVTPSGDPKVFANSTTQFGTDKLDIDASQWLCVQAAKRIATNLPTNRFPIPLPPILQKQPDLKCYSTDNTGKAPNTAAKLWDQFHNETVDISSPAYYCTPVTKIFGSAAGVPPAALVSPHIECYNIAGSALNINVNLRDVFENETGVTVGVPRFLCAFSIKRAVTPEQPVGRTTITPSLLLIALATITISFAVVARRRKNSTSTESNLNNSRPVVPGRT